MPNSESPQQSTSLTVEQAFARAIAHHQAGELPDAERLYRTVLSVRPGHADARRNLGALMMQVVINAFSAGHYEEAESGAKKLIEHSPEHSFGWKVLGATYRRIGRHAEALESLRKGVGLLPLDAEIHNTLGVALIDTGETESAVHSFLRAVDINPEYAEAQNNLGNVLRDTGQLEKASAAYRRALEINPALHATNWDLCLALLTQGRYSEGWPYYESQFALSDKRIVAAPDFTFLQWQGQPLVGRSIVIVEEQGIGDDLQFFRYAATLKEMGATRVTLLCKNRVRPLFARISGVDSVIERRDAATVEVHDFWAYAHSLPLHCGTTVDTIPAAVPYLSADEALTARVAGELGQSTGLKIGIGWKGNPTYKTDSERSPGIEPFKPILSIDGTRIYTLLPNSRAELNAVEGRNVVDIGHELDESTAPFAETAALIMNLDLVITCDTSIGHLAGALGKPVWLVIPYAAHWVWMTDREDSPWYPNTRLFRQTERGNWADVFARVAHKIRSVLAGETPLVWPIK